MSLNDRIREARKSKGITQEELGQLIGVAKTTIAGYEKTREPTAAKIGEIADALGVDANFLLQDEIKMQKLGNQLSEKEVQGIKKYRALDMHGKKMVEYVLDEETARMESVNKPIEDNVVEFPKTREITFIENSFAAGPAEPDMGNLCSTIEVDANQKGDFAIKISGDSMEPYLHDGQIAFGVRELPRIGDVGAFFLDGEFLCKQYVEDGFGNVYLISLNRAREDCDVKVWRNANRNLICFGKVLLKKKPPMP